MATIKIATESYNDRRHSRPWIARVTGYSDGKPQLAFGNWVGRNGDDGLLTIDAEPGDIIRHGQKDMRRADYSRDDWFVVADDGSLAGTTPVAAYEHFLSRQQTVNPLAKFNDDEIFAEARRRGLVG